MRIWPETLLGLGVDPASLTCACNCAATSGAGMPGPNPVNLHVLALMGDTEPRKVIRLAKLTPEANGTRKTYPEIPLERSYFFYKETICAL